MKYSLNGIPYGTTYSLVFDPEETWGQNMELMSRAGMNIVRVGDISTWEQIEASEAEISLDKLQRFYNLASKFNLHILLGTGSATPPLWLYYKYPDVRIRSNRGDDYPLGASYHWACIHHPGYLKVCQRYIEELANFAVRQPNHFGWQISNEIGFPFNPTRESGEVDLYCYCDHTKKAFSEWLKNKYKHLDELAKAWTWSTTNFHYRSWEEAFPPEALPMSWSGVSRWIDWRLFWQQAFADHAYWQHETIRRHDPDHPTVVNTFNFKSYDRFGTYTGLDQWKISKKVDHIGYDLYPGSGNKLATRPEHISIFLDHGRSVSQFAGSEFWLPEVESGPINGWLLGPDRNTDENDFLAYGFEALGHNGKMLMYMLWRDWEFQPLRWGSIVDIRGNPTRRYFTAQIIGEYLQKNSAFIKQAQVARGDVALLESKPNAIFLRGVGQEDELFDAQRGAYRAFWEQDYSVDFITPEQAQVEQLDRYKFVCLPLIGTMSIETAKALLEYVQRGGILIAFARVGTLTEQGWIQPNLPIPDLGKAFGIKAIEADTLDGQKINLQGKTYDGWLNRDVITLSEGTEVLGLFDDGQPAVTMASVGSGIGTYIATQADGSLVRNNNTLLKEVIKMVANRAGIGPRLTIEYSGKNAREIDPHILDTFLRTEIILVSYLNKTAQVNLRLVETKRIVESMSYGLLEQKPLKFSQDKDAINLALEMKPREIISIVITWKGAVGEAGNAEEVSRSTFRPEGK